MGETLKPDHLFKIWTRAKLCLNADEFDDKLFDRCEELLLLQDVRDDIGAVQVLAVIQGCLEDGGRSDGLDLEALGRVLDFMLKRTGGETAVLIKDAAAATAAAQCRVAPSPASSTGIGGSTPAPQEMSRRRRTR
ncbi:hypothetical protein E4M02_05855 [Brevundimonas sp. S30B]|uniref:hypothetical protein n=1 Tax=unclassified Brevundimonas TaxID=2622653 RepID=UPI0010720B90|nr:MULTISPECIES: hypothetical protein [unclassified Brevundimonas]QBX38119.1 hypothetical protein E4M01_10285 [Brevundimonas sp. MF30-B]TFW02526.1 hypothetical protein E4M02_05855 [Brevundimonas sp. S30B]